MTTTPEHDSRVAKMIFASVYPHYVTKVEKKGRTHGIIIFHLLFFVQIEFLSVVEMVMYIFKTKKMMEHNISRGEAIKNSGLALGAVSLVPSSLASDPHF